MNIQEKISQAGSKMAEIKIKSAIPKVVAVAVVSGGVIWGGVTYKEKVITKTEKTNVCSELKAQLSKEGSLSGKVKIAKARTALNCK